MEPVAFKTTAQVTEEAVNYIKERKNHTIRPLKSRWQKFNRVTCGGIEPNMIFTIAGSSGSGKYSSSCLKFSKNKQTVS